MAIVGTLAAIAVPMFSKARDSARAEEAGAQLEILAAAIRELAWDTGEWPNGIPRDTAGDRETWDLTTAAAGVVQADGRFSNWNGPYVRELPLDPWGSSYFFDPDYRVEGVMRVAVGSFGPNRQGRNLYDADDLYVLLDE